MSIRSNTMSTPKAITKRPGAVKPLDPDNPNDMAFKLVISFVFSCVMFLLKKNSFFCPFFPSIALFLRPPGTTNLMSSSSQATEHGVKLTVAMRMTGSTCALSTLYGRVDRFRKRKAEEELADTASYEIKKGRRLLEPIIAGIHRE